MEGEKLLEDIMGKIYVLMGKSATGKDTVFKRLIGMKELALHTVVGYTTRPIRRGEADGKEYFFVSVEKWKLFPTQGSNLGLPHCRQMLYRPSYQGNTFKSMLSSSTREEVPTLRHQRNEKLLDKTHKIHILGKCKPLH